MTYLLDTVPVRRYVCEVFEEYCPTEFATNRLVSVDECLDVMNSLEIATGNGYVDGNSSSCRVVHAYMATENNYHCPHISFVPLVDSDGYTKCQESQGVVPSDLLQPSDFEFFEEHMIANGIDPSLGYQIGCTDSSTWSFGGGVFDCMVVSQYPRLLCLLPGANVGCEASCNSSC